MSIRNCIVKTVTAFLLATAVFSPEKAYAQTCSDAFAVKILPGKAELRAKLPAVHLTDYLPRGGKILAHAEGRARFMPTVHFALGEPVIDHDFGRWSDKKYAIVLPAKDIASQLLNVFPQDAFVLGHVTLTEDARVFVPRGEDPEDVGLAQVIYYDPGVPIKKVVIEFIQQEGLLQLRASGTKPRDSVSFRGEDVTGLSFWEGLADRPTTYELHIDTTIGRIDEHTREAFRWVFKGGMPAERSIEELENDLEDYRSLLQTAEAELKGLKGLPSAAYETYELAVSRLKNFYIKILEFELALQKEQGKTLMGWEEGRRAGILKALESRSDLMLFVEKHLSKLPTLKQAEDMKRLYRVLSSVRLDFFAAEFFKTGVLKSFASSTPTLAKKLSKFQQDLVELNEVLADLKGAFLSRDTVEKIRAVEKTKLYFKFIELELELRARHGKTMQGIPGGQQKLVAAMNSVSSLENFVRQNTSLFPTYSSVP